MRTINQHVDDVRTALSMHDAGYLFQPDYRSVSALLLAHDQLRRAALDAVEAIERGSTSAPVAEVLKAALNETAQEKGVRP